MEWSWAKVSVVAIALAALGCSPDQDDDRDGERPTCFLEPSYGISLTVKGTAQYTTEVTGDAVVEGIDYYDPQGQNYVDKPTQPFSVTVELEAGDLLKSKSYGHMTIGSILARDTFTPADGSAIMVHEQTCSAGLPP